MLQGPTGPSKVGPRKVRGVCVNKGWEPVDYNSSLLAFRQVPMARSPHYPPTQPIHTLMWNLPLPVCISLLPHSSSWDHVQNQLCMSFQTLGLLTIFKVQNQLLRLFHAFIYSFNKCLFQVFYVPSTVLNTIDVIKTCSLPIECLYSFFIQLFRSILIEQIEAHMFSKTTLRLLKT